MSETLGIGIGIDRFYVRYQSLGIGIDDFSTGEKSIGIGLDKLGYRSKVSVSVSTDFSTVRVSVSINGNIWKHIVSKYLASLIMMNKCKINTDVITIQTS